VTIRVPGNWGVPEGALYEEITEPGDVVFAWPDAPPGSKVTYDLAQAPADSTATATLSGAIDGADLPGAYVLERTCTHMGAIVRKDIAVALLNTAVEVTDLTAPTPPAVQVLASGTTSASATWTHPGAPPGTTYACTVRGSDGSTPTASGSGLGAWTWTAADGVAYAASLSATGTDGQTSQSSALVQVAASSAIAGAWTKIGDVTYVGAVPQTFVTTGDKIVVLSGGGTLTVNATMSGSGSITTGTAGIDATRGLIADVPGGVATTAYRLRSVVPLTSAIEDDDDVLVLVRGRVNQATGTGQRALVGVTITGGSEASAEFSGVVWQNTVGDVVKLQARKGAAVADISASLPTGWRNGTTRIQTEVRVVGKARTALVTADTRNPDSGAADYIADIGGDSSGPNAGLEAPLFSGSTINVHLYSWNGGASGGACAASIERIQVFRRPTSRIP
jgi:hypothetical protein